VQFRYLLLLKISTKTQLILSPKYSLKMCLKSDSFEKIYLTELLDRKVKTKELSEVKHERWCKKYISVWDLFDRIRGYLGINTKSVPRPVWL
jgi:hypothetical protein